MSQNLFFKPYKGSLFETEGFCGKRILIMGASFYCTVKKCRYFDICTCRTRKDSSSVDSKCPLYVPHHRRLSESPTVEIEDGGTAYVRFGNLLASHYYPGESWRDVFNRISFTNYVQFVLPEMKTSDKDITDRDLQAFYEALDYTLADIIIVWGCVINRPITEQAIDKESLLKESGGYLCHIKHGDRTIAVINPYHPSFSWCYREQSKRDFFNAFD